VDKDTNNLLATGGIRSKFQIIKRFCQKWTVILY